MSLSKLIEAVEAGAARPGDYGHPDVMFMEVWLPTVSGPQLWQYASEAYDGSLDAAKRLHDALLPGWGGAAGYDYYTGLCRSQARVSHMGKHYQAHIDDVMQVSRPARAWLLAILRALEQEGRDG